MTKLEGKYSLESTDPCESEIHAPRQLTIALKLSYYLFITAKLFKVKDDCLKFVYNIKIPGLRRFWTVTSTPGKRLQPKTNLGLLFPLGTFPKNFIQISPRFI